jgi:hypothetical protein
MTTPLAQCGAAALGLRSSRVSSRCRHAKILTHFSPLDEIRQPRSSARTMPRVPVSKARMRGRFVSAACADAAMSGWRRRVYNTSLQPSHSTWSGSPSGTTTLIQQTRVSHGLRLYRRWLDRAGRLNSPPVSSLTAVACNAGECCRPGRENGPLAELKNWEEGENLKKSRSKGIDTRRPVTEALFS